MKITDIVKKVNSRMNYDSFPYDDLHGALDAAIDNLNSSWRTDFPLITDLPEMVREIDEQGTQGNLIPAEYTALPDEFIRAYIVPYAAGQQYLINEQDGTPEFAQAASGLAQMSERYPVEPGQTILTKDHANFKILKMKTKQQFANGHNHYGYPTKTQNGYDPLGDYDG